MNEDKPPLAKPPQGIMEPAAIFERFSATNIQNIGLAFASLIGRGSCKLELVDEAQSTTVTEDLKNFSKCLFRTGGAIVVQAGRNFRCTPESDADEAALPRLTNFVSEYRNEGLVIVNGVDYHSDFNPKSQAVATYLAGLIAQNQHERPMLCTVGPRVEYLGCGGSGATPRTPFQQFLSRIATPSFVVNAEGAISYALGSLYTAARNEVIPRPRPQTSKASIIESFAEQRLGTL